MWVLLHMVQGLNPDLQAWHDAPLFTKALFIFGDSVRPGFMQHWLHVGCSQTLYIAPPKCWNYHQTWSSVNVRKPLYLMLHTTCFLIKKKKKISCIVQACVELTEILKPLCYYKREPACPTWDSLYSLWLLIQTYSGFWRKEIHLLRDLLSF